MSTPKFCLRSLCRRCAGLLLALLPALPLGATTLRSDLEDLGLAPNQYDNGASGSGGFHSRHIFYENAYTVAWGSWSGFAASTVADTNSPGWANQYAVWTPGTDVDGDGAYAVAYDDPWQEADVIRLPFPATVKGLYLNNTTYAALAMRVGDDFAKKFGGASGHDPDWFKLTITGKDADGVPLGTVEFYLADYRFAASSQDYIIGDWTWVNLAALGRGVRSLHFALSSSDTGEWGMNTPAFFALDRLEVVPEPATLTCTLDGVSLPADQDFANGSDGRGGFRDLAVTFSNTYNAAWGSWSGFACSRVNDTNHAGWANQYAVWTPGKDSTSNGQYAVVYDDPWNEADVVVFPFVAWVQGFYVNNTTYAALAMRDGDDFAKKFGGAGGSDPDWFKLTVTARNAAGAVIGSREVYLADFRAAGTAQDFILNRWQWVDLATLGPAVKSLHFALSSSDTGEWGMNTPAFFALDGLRYLYGFSGGLGDSGVLYDSGVPGFVGPAGNGRSGAGQSVNPAFVAWASSVVAYAPAPDVATTWTNTARARGAVSGDNFDIVSLGDLSATQLGAGVPPGRITLAFPVPIHDGPGPDFAVFENGFGAAASLFCELGYVEVSSDGSHFARFPSASLATNSVSPYASQDPRFVNNLCGRHANNAGESWGTPFDLGELAAHPMVLSGQVSLTNIVQVRIVDIPGKGSYYDDFAPSNRIYDAWLTFGSGGVDLEAVGVLNSPAAARIELRSVGPGTLAPLGQPGGVITVLKGATTNITINAWPGYHIGDVAVDGDSIGPTNGYRFNNVQHDRRLTATFGSRLTILSPHGQPQPESGAHILYGTTRAMMHEPALTLGATQYLCAGWSRSGAAPGAGSGTDTGEFPVTNDVTLAWRWQTNFWLHAAATAGGSIAPTTSGWHTAGATLTLRARPDPYYVFDGWTGDLAGASENAALNVVMTQARRLTATFWAELAVHNVPRGWLDFHRLGGDPDSAALSDDDGDDQRAWQEFYAGTDPNDPQSRLAITRLEADGHSLALTWLGGTNGSTRPFEVYGRERLDAAWELLDGNVARDSLGTNRWVRPSSGAPRFYRVGVSP